MSFPPPLDGLNFPEVYVRTPGGDGILGNNAAGVTDDGYVRLGPDFSRQYNALYYRNDYFKALGNYTWDTHNFEAGIEFHELRIDDKFVQGAGGVVRFDSEADFAARKISTQVITASNGINTSTSNAQGNPIYFATGAGGNPAAADGAFSYRISSIFAQDTWYPMKNMTVLAGIRYDRYDTQPQRYRPQPLFLPALWLLQYADAGRAGRGVAPLLSHLQSGNSAGNPARHAGDLARRHRHVLRWFPECVGHQQLQHHRHQPAQHHGHSGCGSLLVNLIDHGRSVTTPSCSR